MTKIEELEAMVAAGNHNCDSLIFQLADDIIRDTSNSIDVRYRAIIKIERTMGVADAKQSDSCIDKIAAIRKYIDLTS